MAKPVFNAYTVIDYQRNGKRNSKWTKIGVVFSHKDGEGYDIALDALPINGRISLRKPKSKEAVAAAIEDEEEARAWFEEIPI